MQIGLIYSKEDPRQAEARDFVVTFIKEHGILANVVERHQPVASPRLIINGEEFSDRRQEPRSAAEPMYPGKADLKKVLEQMAWCL